MAWKTGIALAASLTLAHGQNDTRGPTLLKFSCASLVTDRIDPLVEPGIKPSSHLHQIMGGNAFNATMSPATDPAALSTCTSCTMTEDFSNYWTAVMFFQARNGSYTRIHQLGGLFSEESNGGMTVYYFPQTVNWEGIKIRAFAPGFRMRVGDPGNRTAWWTDQPAALLKGVTYTCLQRHDTRFTNLSWDFPMAPCPAGIMTTIPFPPCWDGKNLDSPDHRSHVAYPDEDYDKGARCPPSHPVNIPRIVMEIRWDTTPFNDPELWPVDAGRQPFLWSYGDRVGHGHHADYIFGWKGDLLQRFFDQTNCRSGDCGVLDRSSVLKSNECTKEASVKEEIDGWLDKMPGGMVADRWGWDGI